jgi:hypothetical protein
MQNIKRKIPLNNEYTNNKGQECKTGHGEGRVV